MRRLCARCSWSPPLRKDTRPWRSQASTSPTIMRSGYSSTTRRMPRRRSWMLPQLSWWRSAAPPLERRSGSLAILTIASRRKPSMSRSSQKRSTSCIAASTSGLSQLRSGCSAMNECRYHCSVRSSKLHAGPTASNAETQSLGGPAPRARSAIRTSRASDRHARSATPRTTGGGQTCGSEPSRAPRGCRARGTRPRAGRGPRACRTAGRRRGSRRRRSRSRPSAT